MALTGFIPTIWSARLLFALEKAHVFGAPGVVNRDYEGEIREKGDTVKIGSIGDPTVRDYSKNTDLVAPEALAEGQMFLQISQGKYFNFQVDDVDKAQMDVSVMDGAMKRAGYKLKDTSDAYIASLYTDASADNLVGSSGSPKTDLGTATNAYVHLVELATELDEANVPTDGRWAAVPPWYYGKLLLDDRFVKSGTDSAAGTLANGHVGDAAGFRILMSNNVSNNGTTWRIMAGIDAAISYAEQIAKVEAYRPELRFADAVKGLHLYGAKVVQPDALAVLYANKP